MEIKYYGHACFAFQSQTFQFIIDPFISKNPLAKDIDLNSIKTDCILLTHAHYDHILDAEFIAKNNNIPILANPEICKYYEKLGIATIPLNLGGVKKFDFGKIKMVTAQHSSSFPDGNYGGLAAGFLIKMDNKIIYFSGDTALTTDMQLLPGVYGNIDVAILPIGNTYTMGAYDAVIAAKFVKTRQVIASHYDTFPAIEIKNKNKIKSIFLGEEKKIVFMSIGESLNPNIFI